jgi:hypothetical protein
MGLSMTYMIKFKKRVADSKYRTLRMVRHFIFANLRSKQGCDIEFQAYQTGWRAQIWF